MALTKKSYGCHTFILMHEHSKSAYLILKLVWYKKNLAKLPYSENPNKVSAQTNLKPDCLIFKIL